MHSLYMPCQNPIISDIIYGSCGQYFLDHLAADAACLAGGQVAVVAFLQVDANLGSRLHLELVHGLAGLRNVQLVVLAVHNETLLLSFSGRKAHSSRNDAFPCPFIALPKGERLFQTIIGGFCFFLPAISISKAHAAFFGVML